MDNRKYGLGYVAGVFDLFHIGHLNLLRNAKSRCERLMVGVLTDELVMHFKKNLPYIREKERMEIVRAIRYVDQVVPVTFENIEKIPAFNMYHFDCLFSGNDWENHPDWIWDRDRLRELGSNIEFFTYTESTSSTQIKAAIQERIEKNN